MHLIQPVCQIVLLILCIWMFYCLVAEAFAAHQFQYRRHWGEVIKTLVACMVIFVLLTACGSFSHLIQFSIKFSLTRF